MAGGEAIANDDGGDTEYKMKRFVEAWLELGPPDVNKRPNFFLDKRFAGRYLSCRSRIALSVAENV